ncbi:MAG: exopolysaccharide biosynthesis protein [Rickettsiaceae bacterium]|uniref:exopolysaccharide biosynthesis protein n=1 Tax=Candidatus Tisiphia endosymbiont of Ptychoptera albimana TaxID=3066260 RepID=UPI00312C8775|nr:exopolysaccharide biosynthesis protein [Rickettsiaceae bacterium]MDD9336870.1 exopolysaccharide biosynthesis protein [Rickettsiaceae bacterium]
MFNIASKDKQLDRTTVSSVFYKLGQKEKKEKTRISELLVDFHENGLLLTILFFAIPVAIPLPYPPGFTTIVGIPLMILSMQMLLGFRQVSLPSKINNYQISNDILINISDKIVPKIKFVEKYIRPRFSFAASIYCEQFIGLISLICSIAISIPLPLTNAVPALGITIMALGLLNRDGLTIVLGFITSIVGLIIAFIAISASWISIKYLFNLFF